MLEEISNLRDQLLEVLDGKIAVDQGLVPLTTPQVCFFPNFFELTILSKSLRYLDLLNKRRTNSYLSFASQKKALAPELAATVRENELLRIEV